MEIESESRLEGAETTNSPISQRGNTPGSVTKQNHRVLDAKISVQEVSQPIFQAVTVASSQPVIKPRSSSKAIIPEYPSTQNQESSQPNQNSSAMIKKYPVNARAKDGTVGSDYEMDYSKKVPSVGLNFAFNPAKSIEQTSLAESVTNQPRSLNQSPKEDHALGFFTDKNTNKAYHALEIELQAIKNNLLKIQHDAATQKAEDSAIIESLTNLISKEPIDSNNGMVDEAAIYEKELILLQRKYSAVRIEKRGAIAQLQKIVELYENQVSELQGQIDSLIKQSNDSNSKCDALSTELISVKKELSNFTEKQAIPKNGVGIERKAENHLNDRIVALKNELLDAEKIHRQATANADRQITSLSSELSILKQSRKYDSDQYKIKYEDAQKEMISMRSTLNQLQSHINELEKKDNSRNDRWSDPKRSTDYALSLEKQVSNLASELSHRQLEAQQQSTALQQTRLELEQQVSLCQSYVKEIQSLKDQSSTATKTLDQLNAANREIQELKERLQIEESNVQVLKKTLEDVNQSGWF